MARLKFKTARKAPDTKRKKFDRTVEPSNRGGVFLPDNLQLVRMIAMKGATDDEIAETFGISKDMFQRWRRTYPSMEKALDAGRRKVDSDVVVSLYKQTQGYSYTEETTAGKDGHVVEVRKYARPETDACKYWLNNRQPEEWRSATVHTGGRGKDGADLPIGVKVETRNEIIEGILALIVPKPDGNPKPDKATGDARG